MSVQKILVTGGTGFLGTVMMRRLLETGETDLRVLVRPATSRKKLEEMAAGFPGATLEFVTGTLNSRADCKRALDGVGLVYHLAAALSGSPADMFLNSVVASKNLLEELVAQKPMPKLVLVSSFGVYGVAGIPRGAVVDEETPLEEHPERRDIYSQTKLRQEQLFHEYQRTHGFPLVVMRPGVIYGPRGGAFSARVGINLMGVFLHLGGRNVLPLSYVENCVDAIMAGGRNPAAVNGVYNVHDDDLPTASEYLKAYKREVGPVRTVPVPYLALQGISLLVERYHRFSKGQLPAIFTPYKTKTSWGGNRFSNERIKSLGWTQRVPTSQALAETFAYFREKNAR